MKLSYNKLCNVEDFYHQDLRNLIREIFSHEVTRFGAQFPAGFEYRKHWEVGMAVRTLRDFGCVSRGKEVLGIGAGNEPTLFYLTNSGCRVFATDRYCDSGEWGDSAGKGMLTDPGKYWPGPWNPRRLVVQHMDARELRYEDASFDGIFSSSAIEHFGEFEDVQRAVGEMFRVLRPGGVLSISTEFRLQGSSRGLPGILMFNADELRELLMTGQQWSWVSALETAVSTTTLATEQPFAEAANDVRRHTSRYGEILFHQLDWTRYPHVILREGDLLWTSIHIALRRT